MQTARDLMLLAAVAFNNGKFDDAGALFASALSSDDAGSFLNEVNRIGNPDAENLDIESVSSGDGMSLSQIAQSLSGAIKESMAGDDESEDEDEDMEDEESEDSDEEDEEEDSEDEESISTSSGSGIQRRSKGEPRLVISVANSPIKLKQ